VPTAHALRVSSPIKIDGSLTEPAWAAAETLELKDAVDPETRAKWRERGPRWHQPQATHARFLWDDQNLYLAFEVEDDDIWAHDCPRDTTSLPGDEVVELFLDVDGAGTTYYELELSPKNVVYDLLVQRPTPPAWRPLPQGFVGHEGWDWRGMESAVTCDGAVDVIPNDKGAASSDRTKLPPSKRWIAELKLPFAALRGRRVPPRPGDAWRMNVTRVERYRPEKDEDAQFPELMSWAPLGGKDSDGHVSFHRPWRFGWIEFTDRPANR
jgi:hypothetical protein